MEKKITNKEEQTKNILVLINELEEVTKEREVLLDLIKNIKTMAWQSKDAVKTVLEIEDLTKNFLSSKNKNKSRNEDKEQKS